MSTPSQRFAQKMEQTGMSPMLKMATKGLPDPKKAKLKKAKAKKGKAGKVKAAKASEAPKYDFKAGLAKK